MNSPITYSFASNTFLFVPRYVFPVFQSESLHATLTPVHPESSLEPSVQKYSSPGPSVCLLVFFAPSSLPPVMGAMLLGEIFGFIHLVYSVPVAVSMLVYSAIIRASSFLSASLRVLMSLYQLSSSSGSPPECVYSFPSRSATWRMFLVGCDLGAMSNMCPFLCCQLLTRDSTVGVRSLSQPLPTGLVRTFL